MFRACGGHVTLRMCGTTELFFSWPESERERRKVPGPTGSFKGNLPETWKLSRGPTTSYRFYHPPKSQAKHRAFRHEVLKISARADSGAKWNTTKAFWKRLVTLKEVLHLPRRWTRFSSSSPTTSFCLFLILFMWTVFLKETASFWLFNADQAWALRIGNCTVTQPHSHRPIACISRVLALHLA